MHENLILMSRETIIWAVHRPMTLVVLLLTDHLLMIVFFCKDQRHTIAWLFRGVAQVLEQVLEPSPGETAGKASGLSGCKKSVQITTARRAVVSVASNLPPLRASTNICVVRWQVGLWDLKNSLAKTNERIYFPVLSVFTEKLVLAQGRSVETNNWGEEQDCLFWWLCLFW